MNNKLRKLSQYAAAHTRALLPNANKRSNREHPFSLVVASAHKVGSTWLYRMIRDLDVFQFWRVPKAFRSDRDNPALLDLQKPGVDRYMLGKSGFHLYKSHTHPPAWTHSGKIQMVSVFRDPRDIVVSNIFYLANLDPGLGGWPELQGLSVAERIRAYLTRGIYDLELLEKWHAYGGCHKVFYEDLQADTEQTFTNLIESLGLAISRSEISRIIQKNSFKKLSSGRSTGQEEQSSFYRKGISGDWVNHFGEEERQLFKTLHDGKWNELLVKLGYEKSLDWT